VNCWEVLATTPTVDRMAVSQAYVRALCTRNPVADPAGVEAVRAAYEAALLEAEQLQASDIRQPIIVPGLSPEFGTEHHNIDPAGNRTPVSGEHIAAQVTATYADPSKRFDASVWQEILGQVSPRQGNEDERLSRWMFDFVVDHRHLPAVAFALLHERFGWLQRLEELKDIFGEETVDSVLARMRNAAWMTSHDGLFFPAAMSSEAIDSYLDDRDALEKAIFTDSEHAERLVESLTASNVTDPELLRLVASYHTKAGRVDEALRVHSDSIERCGDTLDAHLERAKLYAAIGDHDSAWAGYSASLALDHSHGIALRGLAACFDATGHQQVAAHVYEIAQRTVVFDVESRLHLHRLKRGQLESAENELSADPKNSHHALRVARLHFDLGAYDQARETLERVGALDYTGQLLLGRTYLKLDSPASASNALRCALSAAEQERRNGFEALMTLAVARHEVGEFGEAAELLERARKLDPTNSQVVQRLADNHRRSGNDLLALETINEAIAMDASNWLFFDIRSRIRMGMDQYHGAIADLDVVLRHRGYPDHEQAFLRKGVCYILSDEPDEAIDSLIAATKYAPNDPEPHFHLATAYREVGEFEAELGALHSYRNLEGERDKEALSLIRACEHRLAGA